jgi:diguanylate cyclase (GGDEF)-like protein/PAS domain S-box-containing protein
VSRFLAKRRSVAPGVPAQPRVPAGAGDRHWHELLKSAAALARAAGDTDEALAWALALIRDYSGWCLGHALLLDTASDRLRSAGVWQSDDAHRFAAFVEASGRLELDRGVGLPGRVLERGQPVWIRDVATDENFPRAAEAAACGLRTAAAVPIPSARGVVGVLEFFSDDVLDLDARLLDLVAHVAGQLGVIVDRSRDVRDRESAELALRRSEQDLAEAQRLAHIGSWSWDVTDNQVIWSAELHRIYGLDPGGGPASFEQYLSRVHPDDRERVATAVQRTIQTQEPYEHEYRIVWPDGRVRWVHAAGAVSAVDDGRPARLGGFCHDITDWREAEADRRQARDELESHRQTLERIARGERVEITLDLLCRAIEQRFPGARCSILTATAGERVLRHAAAPSLAATFRKAIDGLGIGDGIAACGTAAARGEDVVVSDVFNDVLTADFVELAKVHELHSVWSHPLFSAAGQLLGTFAVYRSEVHTPSPEERRAVSAAGSIAAVALERSLAEKALTAAARVDPLTGLANRATFLSDLAFRLTIPDTRTAVLFLDLDGFKWINDSLGHPIGDRVLVEVASRFEAALNGQHLLARFGGDEFSVLAGDVDDGDLHEIAAALTDAMAAPFTIESSEFFLSVSIGIATNEFAASADDMVRDADSAMYEAKTRGRGRHAVFDNVLRERALERVTTESELRRALERDEFVMHYQPIIRLNDGRTTGLESLVRWQHPTRGLLPPDRFVPLAEEDRLIVAIGQRVLERVLSETVRSVFSHDVHVGVNVSVVELSDPTFMDGLADALKRHGFPPERLFVEVTETAVMREFDIALANVKQLAALGVRVLIDDFGTGYSSLARLRDLPVAGVKIDKRFSARLGADAETDRTLAAVAGLAHAMQLQVVVEGIETPAAAERVRAFGCDYAQGFHYARPAPLDQLNLD